MLDLSSPQKDVPGPFSKVSFSLKLQYMAKHIYLRAYAENGSGSGRVNHEFPMMDS